MNKKTFSKNIFQDILKINKIITEIPYQVLCRNYVVRTYLEKENIATALILMLKEASKNVVSVINGTFKVEIGQKMQTLDKIEFSKIIESLFKEKDVLGIMKANRRLAWFLSG